MRKELFSHCFKKAIVLALALVTLFMVVSCVPKQLATPRFTAKEFSDKLSYIITVVPVDNALSYELKADGKIISTELDGTYKVAKKDTEQTVTVVAKARSNGFRDSEAQRMTIPAKDRLATPNFEYGYLIANPGIFVIEEVPVENATSYEVKLDGKVLTVNASRNRYKVERTTSKQTVTVVAKANRYADSNPQIITVPAKEQLKTPTFTFTDRGDTVAIKVVPVEKATDYEVRVNGKVLTAKSGENKYTVVKKFQKQTVTIVAKADGYIDSESLIITIPPKCTHLNTVWSIETDSNNSIQVKNQGVCSNCGTTIATTATTITAGDTVKMGTYNNKAIEWDVKKDASTNEIVLLSKYNLYNSSFGSSVTWKDSTIRSDLDPDGTVDKLNLKSYTSIIKPVSHTEKGKTSEDKVYLLSYDEAGFNGNRVFSDNDSRVGKVKNGASQDWWLRSPCTRVSVYCVNSDGDWFGVNLSGYFKDSIGVRPALQLNL